MQGLALSLSLVLMASVAAVFLWVVAAAGRPGADGGAVAGAGYRWRNRLFWLVLVAGVMISFATLWKWPISGYAAAAARPDVVIHATGHQWFWEMDRDTVQPGQLVEFQVTSADVNHGFALYEHDKSRIIVQTQAMPGYTNKLRVRFQEPGDYEVLCLEYCGLAHHAMRTVIKVRAGS